MITKKLSFPVHLSSCSTISSDHLQVLVDTGCRSSFHHQPDRPEFRQTELVSFQSHVEGMIPFDSEMHKEMEIDTCVENFSGVILKALTASNPKRRRRDEPRPPISAGIQEEIA